MVTIRQGKGHHVYHDVFDDVRVFVDAESQLLLAGAEVDFSDSPVAGFVFNNPNACSKTGCDGNPRAGARC